MPDNLMTLQKNWISLLRDPEQSELMSDVLNQLTGGERSGAQGFAIYVNNVRGTLINALSQTFPVALSLVSRSTFNRAVLHCLRHSPPEYGDLGEYGKEFPLSLEAAVAIHGDSSKAALVGDVARCEWASDQLQRVSYEPGLAIADLQELSIDDWLALSFRLAHNAQLFVARRPIYSVLREVSHSLVDVPFKFQLHDATLSGLGDITPEGEEFNLLLVSYADGVHVLPLSSADRSWLKAIESGMPLEQATDTVLSVWPQFELQPLLTEMLSMNALSLAETTD